jgi:hypothetical protein
VWASRAALTSLPRTSRRGTRGGSGGRRATAPTSCFARTFLSRRQRQRTGSTRAPRTSSTLRFSESAVEARLTALRAAPDALWLAAGAPAATAVRGLAAAGVVPVGLTRKRQAMTARQPSSEAQALLYRFFFSPESDRGSTARTGINRSIPVSWAACRCLGCAALEQSPRQHAQPSIAASGSV